MPCDCFQIQSLLQTKLISWETLLIWSQKRFMAMGLGMTCNEIFMQCATRTVDSKNPGFQQRTLKSHLLSYLKCWALSIARSDLPKLEQFILHVTFSLSFSHIFRTDTLASWPYMILAVCVNLIFHNNRGWGKNFLGDSSVSHSAV